MDLNVVVIVVDALRADRVGAVGGRDLTPRIDEFADEATVFRNAFSTVGCSTDPAVTSIQTGKYPLSHGIVNHGFHVTDAEKRAVEDVRQLPEVLSESGYYTAKLGRPLGRWHRRGFDEYPSFEEGRKPFDTRKHRVGQTLEEIHPLLKDGVAAVYNATVGRFEGESSEPNDTGSDLRDRFDRLLERDQPFYGFVHLMDTHRPYDADPDLVQSCLDRFDYDNEPRESVNGKFPDGVEQFPDFIDERWADSEYGMGTAVVSAHYDATVVEADRRIGRLLDRLHAESQFDDTLIAILADHGESLTEHGIYYGHNGLYDETIHVPLIFKPPGNSGGTCEDLVQITDVGPTILSYLGLEDRMETDGRSLVPAIESKEAIH